LHLVGDIEGFDYVGQLVSGLTTALVQVNETLLTCIKCQQHHYQQPRPILHNLSKEVGAIEKLG
jgi:hypothetical protein